MAYEIGTNLRAFLWVIRHCEGTAGPNGYRTLFGGGLFDSFDKHPRKSIPFRLKGKLYYSTAAGAYQFLARTWDGLVRQYKFKDFSPENQDQGAVRLIQGRRALQDIERGDLLSALKKCSLEWASLPFSPYGQPIKSVDFCKKIYLQYGGKMSEVTEKEMPAPLAVAVGAAVAKPFVEAAFTELLDHLPTLAKLFSSGSDVANRNIKVMEAAVDVVKTAVGAKNEQEAVDIVKRDPEAAKEADDAIQRNYFNLFNSNQESINRAREFAEKVQKVPAWQMPVFWISVLLLPLLYYTVFAVLSGDLTAGFTSEIKAQTAGAIISGILGGVGGFWLGASYSNNRKASEAAKDA